MNACKKDKEEVPLDDPAFHNYSQLKIGNYWEYEEYYAYGTNSIDSLIPQHIFRRMEIEKDTIIYGKRFYKKVTTYTNSPQRLIEYFRDSGNYILQLVFPARTARIVFSSLPNDTIKKCDQFFDCTTIYMTGFDTLTTPAGKFNTLSYGYNHNYSASYNLTTYNTQSFEFAYAANMGLVQQTIIIKDVNPAFTQFNKSEIRLINYYVGQ